MGEGEPASYWVNVYRPLMGCCGSVHPSRELADEAAAENRVACVEVKIGVGLGATLFNSTRQWNEQ
jgi:hypothetical protein